MATESPELSADSSFTGLVHRKRRQAAGIATQDEGDSCRPAKAARLEGPTSVPPQRRQCALHVLAARIWWQQQQRQRRQMQPGGLVAQHAPLSTDGLAMKQQLAGALAQTDASLSSGLNALSVASTMIANGAATAAATDDALAAAETALSQTIERLAQAKKLAMQQLQSLLLQQRAAAAAAVAAEQCDEELRDTCCSSSSSSARQAASSGCDSGAECV